MATLSDIADEVLLAFEGYGLDMPRGAHLVGDLSGSGLSFPVTSAAFVQEGLAEIGDELIDIVSVSDSGSGSPIVTVAPDGRGFRGTPVSFHPAGSRVTCSPPIPRDLIRRKVNETITGLWPTLWAQGDHEFTMTGSASLYPLPGDAEEVVSVRFEDRGPGNLWPAVRSWRMEHSADTVGFPSGKALWLSAPLGARVRVVYRKAPSPIDFGDDITVSGLAASARGVVFAGAMWRLCQHIDVARLSPASASVDAMDEHRPFGTGAQISSYLRRVYELELEEERRRQALVTPPVIHYT